eukprot:gene34283-44286_t
MTEGKGTKSNGNAYKSNTKTKKHTQRTLLYGSQIAAEKKKAEAERHRHQKAAALRNYAKLCKREGIQSNRVKVDGLPASSPDNLMQQKDHEFKIKVDQRQKPSDPNTGSERLSTGKRKGDSISTTDNNGSVVTTARDGERNPEEVKQQAGQKRKERQNKSKQIMKRTRSGQPVLHHRIQMMLDKLQQHEVPK